MNHRSVVIWGSLAVFAGGSALVIYLGTRKPPRPELTWDARFIKAPNDYGVRFLTERNPLTSPEKLPPMEVRELSKAELPKSFASSTSEKSAFEIAGVNSNSGRKVILGEPEPPVDCAKPIVFSDGSEARLKLIVGIDDGMAASCESRFVWAMTPDGKAVTREEAKSIQPFAVVWSSWPSAPHAIHCVFELKGAVCLSRPILSQMDSRHATAFGRLCKLKGDEVMLTTPVQGWNAGGNELAFIAYHGPLKTVDLATTHESEADLNGTSLRHLGTFAAPAGPCAARTTTNGAVQLFFAGKHRRLHFIQCPSGTDSNMFRPPHRDGCILDAWSESSGLMIHDLPLDTPIDFVRVSKFSGARRIRMRLPEFPANHIKPRIEDPLDRPIPAHWDKAGIKLRAALPLLAELNAFYYLDRRTEPLDRKLSEFQGGTLREILAEALASDLRAGAVVEIDRAERTLVVKEPEPGAFQRLAKWLTETALRLGL